MQSIYTIPRKTVCFRDLKSYTSLFLLTLLNLIGSSITYPQLSVTGQIRPRTEFRDGYSSLQKKGEKTAVFTSQRTRINLGYSGYRYRFYVAAQDARVWGQDASTINRNTTADNNGIQWHEAWGEILLLDKTQNLSLKVGRQEIYYDDQKLLGSMDWLQQARYHDAIVLKYNAWGYKLDLGGAFNQNKELLAGTIYNGVPPATAAYSAGTNSLGTNYKSFEYLHLSKRFYFMDLSVLFLSDNFNKYTLNPALNPPKVNEQGIYTRNTAGIFYNIEPGKKLKFEGSFYHQWGHDKNGVSLRGDLASVTAKLQVRSTLLIAPGIDYLSGNDGTSNSAVNHQFDPLYGTPHKFWGNMDYFYASSGFGSQGLLNYFLKTKYNLKDNWTLIADIHGFEAANRLSDGKGGIQNRYLGAELDLKTSYKITKMIEIEAGYSYMKATESMASAQVKNVVNANLNPQWAYMMLNLTPDFLSKK